MICKRCGAEIDTRIRRSDGSIQCPRCKTIYRSKYSSSDFHDQQKRTIPSRNVSRQSASQPRSAQAKSQKRAFSGALNKASTCHKGAFRLPIWSWAAIVLLVICGIFGFSRLHRNDSDVNYYNPGEYNQNPTEDVSFEAGQWDSQSPNDIIEEPEYSFINDSEYCAGGYANGRAWVQYNDGGESPFIALIDESGSMLCSVNIDAYVEKVGRSQSGYKPSFYANAIRDGYCYYWAGNFADTGSFVILDENGRETYSLLQESGSAYKILGYGVGKFIVLNHISNFSENTYKLYAIDAYGNIVSQSSDVPKYDANRNLDFYYMGDGIFVQRNGYDRVMTIYNSNNNIFYEVPSIIGDNYSYWDEYTSFVEKSAVVKLSGGYGDQPMTCIIHPEDLANLESYSRWLNSTTSLAQDGNFDSDLENTYDGVFLVYKNSEERAFYNTQGNVICSLNALYTRYEVSSIGGFSDGFAPVILRGQDKCYYITIIDSNANIQYDPVKLNDDTSNYTTFEIKQEKFLIDSYKQGGQYPILYTNGYVMFGNTEGTFLLSPSGERRTVSDRRLSLSGVDSNHFIFGNSIMKVPEFNEIEAIHEDANTIWYS